MPPPIVAGVGAAVSIGGSILGASAQKKAAKRAASATTEASQANIAAAREFYNRNTANLSPWIQSGTRANALVDSFLYGSTPASYYPQEQQPAQIAQPTGGIMEESSGLRHALPYWRSPDNALAPTQVGGSGILGRMLPYRMTPGTGQAAQPQPTMQPGTQSSGYQAFVNSPYYQFGLNEGMRALNHGLASRGMLESGDAMKSAIRYGQDYGYGRMNEFIELAERQSGRGVQAGGAIAGVGLNALASQTAANNAIGSAAANRAIASGQATANMWSGVGNALGTFAGSIYGR